MAEPDVVIPVRPGDHNPELRWALRSLELIPHGRVWLAGHMPHWIREARCIPTSQNRSKHENAEANIIAACRHDAVAEEFLLWNDDIFLLEPIERMPVLHRGPLREFLAEQEPKLGASAYMRGNRATLDILERLGHPDPLCYELHVPLPLTKSAVLEAHALARAEGMPATRALQLRSLTANHAGLGGDRARDVKVAKAHHDWTPGPLPFVSTTDAMWAQSHPAARHVKDLYPRPGRYEARLPEPARR
jgi:hypothetical protein